MMVVVGWGAVCPLEPPLPVLWGIADPRGVSMPAFKYVSILFIYLFIYLAVTVACGSSQARDQTCATARIQSAVVTKPDP